MKEKEIEEAELIARFMGMIPCDRGCNNCNHWKLQNGLYILLPEYVRDWNALIEVVEKIEALGWLFEFTRFADERNANYCRIGEIDPDLLDIIRTPNGHPAWQFYSESTDKLTAVYLSVLSFIRYYNEREGE